MKIGIITLFPDMFRAITDFGITGRAVCNGLLELRCWNPRDYTQDKHRTVDDRPYGGGPGMVMRVEPLRAAIKEAKKTLPGARVVYMSPQGRPFKDATARECSLQSAMIFICGRYEGIDERLIALEVDEEWSIGDFVMSGGELGAMVVLDAVIRLIPGALGHDDSASEDSFAKGLLDCPHYTRPEVYEGMRVPEVLLGGNHEAIRQWRLKQSLGRTWERRSELLEKMTLSDEQEQLLEAFKRECPSSEGGDSAPYADPDSETGKR